MKNGIVECLIAVFGVGLYFIDHALGFYGIAAAILLLGLYRLRTKDAAAGGRNEVQVAEKKQHMDTLMAYISEHGEVSNEAVQKLLGVSSATAERYLQELETWGHIEQVGETGKNVVYRPKQK
jgi:biotin operon repressor